MTIVLGFLKALFSALAGILWQLFQHHQSKKAGRAEVELANAKEGLEQVRAAQEIEREVSGADLDDLAERMRRFQRP